jgi:hypothetical protein
LSNNSSFADTESLCLISFKPLTFHRRFGAPFSGHLMTALDRTAYPRLGERLTREELDARYRLSEADQAFIRATACGDAGRLTLATLLKARQDLGCFPAPVETASSLEIVVPLL